MTNSDGRAKRTWFDLGADAIGRVFPAMPRCYVCPICLLMVSPEMFDEDPRILTREHVPPRWMDGRALCLTCRTCNNTSGSGPDAQWKRRGTGIDFFRGEMESRARAQFVIGGAPVNVEVKRHPGGIEMDGLRTLNDPAKYKAVMARLGAAAQEGKPLPHSSLRLVGGYNPTAAQVGVLRAAYLAAFAVFGYRYALSEPLDIVREQIGNPDQRLVTCFSITSPTQANSARSIVVVAKPEELRSLAVQIGRSIVFLPQADDDMKLYERIAASVSSASVSLTFEGRLRDWPRGPMHQFDTLT